MRTKRGRGLRAVATSLAASVIASSAVVAGATSANAVTWVPVESRTVSVPESSGGVPVYMTFERGDEARIKCSGSVWGGVWFTGSNGPDGWADAAPSNFPMPGYAGGRSFAAIARFKATWPYTYTTGWAHAGTSSAHMAPFQSRMELRVNDNAPGNGSGSFSCTVERWQQA